MHVDAPEYRRMRFWQRTSRFIRPVLITGTLLTSGVSAYQSKSCLSKPVSCAQLRVQAYQAEEKARSGELSQEVAKKARETHLKAVATENQFFVSCIPWAVAGLYSAGKGIKVVWRRTFGQQKT